MYAVVGCSECGALWIVAGRPETTRCRGCGTRHRFESLKRFVETDDEDAARQARAAMLAERSGHGEAFDRLDEFAAMEDRLEDAGVSDAEYLAGSGVDPEAAAAAGERATGGSSTRSRRDVVIDALRDLDSPTEDDVLAYADGHGVSREYARRALEKLVRAGEATESDGCYRLL